MRGRRPSASAGRLDPLGEDGPEGDQVGVDARVRLDVGVRGAEQLAGVLGGERLDGVDVLAAGVEAAADGALGVLVAEPVAHGQQHGRGGVVLAGDQLERLALVGRAPAPIASATRGSTAPITSSALRKAAEAVAASNGGVGGGAGRSWGPPGRAWSAEVPRRAAGCRGPLPGGGPPHRASHGPGSRLSRGDDGVAGHRPDVADPAQRHRVRQLLGQRRRAPAPRRRHRRWPAPRSSAGRRTPPVRPGPAR